MTAVLNGYSSGQDSNSSDSSAIAKELIGDSRDRRPEVCSSAASRCSATAQDFGPLSIKTIYAHRVRTDRVSMAPTIARMTGNFRKGDAVGFESDRAGGSRALATSADRAGGVVTTASHTGAGSETAAEGGEHAQAAAGEQAEQQRSGRGDSSAAAGGAGSAAQPTAIASGPRRGDGGKGRGGRGWGRRRSGGGDVQHLHPTPLRNPLGSRPDRQCWHHRYLDCSVHAPPPSAYSGRFGCCRRRGGVSTRWAWLAM